MKRIFTLCLLLISGVVFSQSTTLVISQIYGGGGNTGAPLHADFVELHNISGTSQSLSGLSIQYASATNASTWTGVFALPAASIPAGGYYLIRMSTVGPNGVALPTADAVTPTGSEIAMSSTNGKVALVNGVTALAACPGATIIDLVGYGSSNCTETAAVPVLSNTTGGLRNNNGCAETNSNLADFTVGPPAPRNSASPVFICGTISPALTLTGPVNDFGNVFIGSVSAAQTYSISGAGLTGAPGNISVSAPAADFQVSSDNITWSSSTSIPYSSATLLSTPLWVRFAPQTVGPKTGNVSHSGGGVSIPVTLAVSGNGDVPPTPVLTAGTLAAFGNICVGTTIGPNAVTISGINLTNATITVGPLTGFAFATIASGPFTPSLNLTQPGGTYSQDVFVQFAPTANQSYDGNIPVTGGGASTINISASGAGANNPPQLTTGTATAITTTSATTAGSITNTGCTTVSTYGIEWSTTNGFPNGSGTQVLGSNLSAGNYTVNLTGLNTGTTYYYKAFATNAGGTGYGQQESFTTALPTLNATVLGGFGSVCLNTTTVEKMFTLSSNDLSSANIIVGPLDGYSFSSTAIGPYVNSLTLTQSGGAYAQNIYVRFTPTAMQSYTGNIPVVGGGAALIQVPVTGSGDNNPPEVETVNATVFSASRANLYGELLDSGCSPILAYGMEYSGISGFANGTGVKREVTVTNFPDYYVALTDLAPHTTYYFKAYVTNDGGTAYGEEKSFHTDSLPSGLVIYGNPLRAGQQIHYSMDAVRPGHYQTRIINAAGQLVLQREQIIQLNYIDDRFLLPGNLAPGVYILQVAEPGSRYMKSFIIQ